MITQWGLKASTKESKCEKDIVATELKCNYIKKKTKQYLQIWLSELFTQNNSLPH